MNHGIRMMPRSRLRWGWLAGVVVLAVMAVVGAVGERASADGKVFAVAASPATIPGQQALICYKDGVQTLAIETRFHGEGKEFAWVVPLPAAPEISGTTTGVFPSLRAVFLPVVEVSQPQWTIATAWAGLLLFLALLSNKSWARTMAILLIFLFAMCMLMPSLGQARGIAGGGDDVQILDRRFVGSYETQTIRSDSPTALSDWLVANGFEVPPSAAPAIARYVEDGWCFVAARLRRDDPVAAEMTPHPLVFRFATGTPVYPMRLTMTQDRPVSLELYVFGERAASVKGLEVESSSPVEYKDHGGWRQRHRSDAVVIAHAAIAGIVGDLPWATKLVGTIKPGASEDLKVGWAGTPIKRDWKYGRGDAMLLAIACGLLVWCVWLVMLIAWRHSKAIAFGRALRAAMLGFAVCAVIAAGVRAALPTTEVVERSGDGQSVIHTAAYGVHDAIELRSKAGEGVDLAWIREEMKRLVIAAAEERGPEQRVPIEEDSPGNYILRVMDAEYISLLYIGAAGQESEVAWLSTGVVKK
ncbi:MAG: DUF2330 domain-containing protein [Phycisphaerales bacterium]|nr:DUF2330 domain-containing protein [Phycisphaerales bacterium]